MCVCAAALAITDEASIGMLGLMLGLTWLYAPWVIHPRRVVGLLVFAALAAAVVLPNLAFVAGLSPGGERHVVKLVPARLPGYYRPSLSLFGPRGRLMLLFDMFAPMAVGVGAVLHAFLRRGRGRGVLAALYMTLLLLSLFGLTRVNVDKEPLESHRFVIAAFVTAPFVALAMLSSRFSRTVPEKGRSIYAAAIMAVGMAAAVASTLDWGFNYAPSWATKSTDFDYGAYNQYAINCRDMMGSRTGALARYTYVSESLYYIATGCAPMFTPGYLSGHAWKSLTIGLPYLRAEAFTKIRKAVPEGATIPLVCPVKISPLETICTAAEASGSCRVVGSVAKACELTAEQAAALDP
jgi:hypothetical protein